MPREHWKGYVPPFSPVFTDGWKPALADSYGTEGRKFNDGDDSTLNEEEGKIIALSLSDIISL